MKKFSVWSAIVNYINKSNVGSLIYRKDMKNNIGNFKSIDVYRKVLSKTGYLSESTGGGEFQILKHIDKNYQDLKILFIEYISKRFQY